MCHAPSVLTTNDHRLRAFLFRLVWFLSPQLAHFDFQAYCEDIFASQLFAPLWVRFVSIGNHGLGKPMGTRGQRWMRAAFFLRRSLYHAAHINARKTGGLPKLTTADVQALPEQLRKPEAADYTSRPKPRASDLSEAPVEALQALKLNGRTQRHPLTAYFPWLENAEVAEDIAKTWNELVDHNEHTKVRCNCGEC